MHSAIYESVFWFSGVAYIHGQLEEDGWDQSAMGICTSCYI